MYFNIHVLVWNIESNLHLFGMGADYEVICAQALSSLFFFGGRGADDGDMEAKSLAKFNRYVSEPSQPDYS